MTTFQPQDIKARSPEDISAMKRRNVWLAFSLLAFVVLIGATSVIRISGTEMAESEGFYFSGASYEATPPSGNDEQ